MVQCVKFNLRTCLLWKVVLWALERERAYTSLEKGEREKSKNSFMAKLASVFSIMRPNPTFKKSSWATGKMGKEVEALCCFRNKPWNTLSAWDFFHFRNKFLFGGRIEFFLKKTFLSFRSTHVFEPNGWPADRGDGWREYLHSLSGKIFGIFSRLTLPKKNFRKFSDE